MSLWSIDDAATLFQMGHFIAHLEKGIPPAEAMRLAMITGRERYPEPRYWAAFNRFRESREIDRESMAVSMNLQLRI